MATPQVVYALQQGNFQNTAVPLAVAALVLLYTGRLKGRAAASRLHGGLENLSRCAGRLPAGGPAMARAGVDGDFRRRAAGDHSGGIRHEAVRRFRPSRSAAHLERRVVSADRASGHHGVQPVGVRLDGATPGARPELADRAARSRDRVGLWPPRRSRSRRWRGGRHAIDISRSAGTRAPGRDGPGPGVSCVVSQPVRRFLRPGGDRLAHDAAGGGLAHGQDHFSARSAWSRCSAQPLDDPGPWPRADSDRNDRVRRPVRRWR